MSDDPAVRATAALGQYSIGDATMEQTLTRIAALTLEALPSTVFVGMTLVVAGKVGTYVLTDPAMLEIDRVQYETGTGPCIDAYLHSTMFVIDSTETDPRWPEFNATAHARGIASALALPLVTDHGPIGVLNLYAHQTAAYSVDQIEQAEHFASRAAFVLSNAQAYWDAFELSQNLRAAMEFRGVIEQAKGIIMASQRKTADEAFEILRDQSQFENTKLHDIAKRIVKDAGPRPAT